VTPVPGSRQETFPPFPPSLLSLHPRPATLDSLPSFAYDPNGQQTVVLDANGQRATSVYDADGRTIAQVNPLGNRTTTMYDGVGNTTALIDARGNRHSFLYDAADCLPLPPLRGERAGVRPSLPPDDVEWADGLLRKAGLRK